MANPSTTSGTGHGTVSHEDPGSFVILFIFSSLLCGALIRWLSSIAKSPIPYTVMLLLFGMVFFFKRFYQAGAALLNIDSSFTALGPLSQALDLLKDIDPAFLPALIFESTSGVDYHIIKKEIWQAGLLALVGVPVCALITAIVPLFMWTQYTSQDHGWEFSHALLFGTIVSATDPVAVVALLRELGASKRLATLIEAESLLNDGSAFVMFVIVLKVVIGDEPMTFGLAVTDFVSLSFGGIALGILAGLLLVKWLENVFEDPHVETTATLSFAYISFFIAEHGFADFGDGYELSGILAVVFLGLTVSKFKESISPEVEHHLHAVWENFGYMANTVLFILSGVIVAEALFFAGPVIDENGVTIKESLITAMDFLYLLLAYIGIHVARFVAIGLMFPILAQLGYGLQWQDAAVMTWGGLRGAIGLALALKVKLDLGHRGVYEEMIGEQMLFQVSGIVLLTLCVNGSTTKALLTNLGLTKQTDSAVVIFQQAIEHLEYQTKHWVTVLKKDKYYKGANWGYIQNHHIPKYQHLVEEHISNKKTETSVEQDSLVSDEQNPEVKEQKSIEIEMAPLSHTEDPLCLVRCNEHDLQQEIRRRFLLALRASFLGQYEEGLAQRKVVSILTEAVNDALDCEDGQYQCLWEEIQGYTSISPIIRKLHDSNHAPGLSRILLFQSLSLGIECLLTFDRAAKAITDDFKSFQEFANLKAYEVVFEEHQKYTGLAKAEYNQIQETFPDVYGAILTSSASRYILHKEKEAITHLFASGILEDNEYTVMQRLVNERVHYLLRNPYETGNIVDTRDVVRSMPFLEGLPEAIRNDVVDHRSQRHTLRAESFLYQREMACVGLFVITRGVVEIISKNGIVVDQIGKGSMLGGYSLLSGQRFFASAKARSSVEIYFIDHDTIFDLIATYPCVETALWKQAGTSLMCQFFGHALPSHFTNLDISIETEKAQFVKPADDEPYFFETSFLLIVGKACHCQQGIKNIQHIEAPKICHSSPFPYRFSASTRLLVFTVDYHKQKTIVAENIIQRQPSSSRRDEEKSTPDTPFRKKRPSLSINLERPGGRRRSFFISSLTPHASSNQAFLDLQKASRLIEPRYGAKDTMQRSHSLTRTKSEPRRPAEDEHDKILPSLKLLKPKSDQSGDIDKKLSGIHPEPDVKVHSQEIEHHAPEKFKVEVEQPKVEPISPIIIPGGPNPHEADTEEEPEILIHSEP